MQQHTRLLLTDESVGQPVAAPTLGAVRAGRQPDLPHLAPTPHRRLARLAEPFPLSFDHDRAIARLDDHNRSDRVEIDAEPDAALKGD
jgi:hypothetical protein